jgi:hypothetical protein
MNIGHLPIRIARTLIDRLLVDNLSKVRQAAIKVRPGRGN